MTEVKGYQTTDGRLYIDYDEAYKHQVELNFVEEYDNNRLYSEDGESYVIMSDLIYWLKRNKGLVLKLLEL